MQHMDLPYLETIVAEDCFQPKGTILNHASPTTSILLNFLSNAEYIDDKHVHIGLIIMHQGSGHLNKKTFSPSWTSSGRTSRQPGIKNWVMDASYPCVILSACLWPTLPAY